MATPEPLPAGVVVDSEDVWNQVLRPPPSNDPRPTLFLDRDGVVIEDAGYLSDPEGVVLIPDAARVIAEANRRGVAVVIVTNQGGIGLGYCGWPEFAAVQARMLDELAKAGAAIDAVYACPHHPRGQGRFAHPDHPARKPQAGMLLRARDQMAVDLARSWIVGDHHRDLEAGKRAGLAGGLHVLTGHGNHEGERDSALALADDRFTVATAPSIRGALGAIPLLRTPRSA
jgi:D-glycero-D-manno-heptose 1,7-bisphosphate phosphatase